MNPEGLQRQRCIWAIKVEWLRRTLVEGEVKQRAGRNPARGERTPPSTCADIFTEGSFVSSPRVALQLSCKLLISRTWQMKLYANEALTQPA